MLKVEGQFTVTGPLETFANAGGVHLARAILAEFAENIAKLMTDEAPPSTPDPNAPPVSVERERTASQPTEGQVGAAPAAELKGGKLLWRAFIPWLRQVFFGKRDAQ